MSKGQNWVVYVELRPGNNNIESLIQLYMYWVDMYNVNTLADPDPTPHPHP